MRCLLIICIFAFGALHGGVIHPQLQEKLTLLTHNEQIRIIIHMRNQADLMQLPKEASKNDKLRYLQEYANSDQTAIMEYLDTLSDRISYLQRYWIFNGLALTATRDIVESVAARADVEYVIDDFMVELHDTSDKLHHDVRESEWNITKVNAPQCWNLGIDGTDVIVGNIDTGVEVTHPALAGKWVDGGWYDAVYGSPTPYDDVDHGTHTMGTICGGDGNGPFTDDIGVAPGSRFICAKAFTRDYGLATWIHNCFQWFAAQNAAVINNSWGNDNPTQLEFWNDCENLRNLGIYPVFSIGNNGSGTGTAGTPGNFPIVTGVGATDSNDDIYDNSSRGPAPNQAPWSDPQYWGRPDWNLVKPDICAPGVNVRSSVPGGGYEPKDGSSMAAPHVAGAIALCLQLEPALDYYAIYNALLDYADKPSQGGPYPNNNYGWGRLNCSATLHYMTSAQPDNQIKPWWGSGYIGDNVYNTTGIGQNVLQFADPYQWAVYHIKIENDGSEADIVNVKADETGTGNWTSRYYDALVGGNDITSEITSAAGWTIILASGTCREILVQVKPGSGMQGLIRRVDVTSRTNGTPGEKVDFVYMITQCNVLQPDNHIKKSNETVYVGDGIYNTTGQNQTKNQDVYRNEKAIYHVKVENDGETYDVDWINGPAGDSHWTIEYFDALAGGNNITNNVVNGTYFVILNNPGAAADLRVEVTPSSSCPWNAQKDVMVIATAGYNAHKQDAVKAATRCTRYKPDPEDESDPLTEEGIQERADQTAGRFAVESAYPNPIKGSLRIRYYSPDGRAITVSLYDIQGRLVEQLKSYCTLIGMNEIVVSNEGLAAGVYFMVVKTDGLEDTRRVMLLK
ncbi:S8 family peptidase [candidate division WOR-3 bacterium]|nr:S8 family peptidase [candidate division WOR-3 bacterium]